MNEHQQECCRPIGSAPPVCPVHGEPYEPVFVTDSVAFERCHPCHEARRGAALDALAGGAREFSRQPAAARAMAGAGPD